MFDEQKRMYLQTRIEEVNDALISIQKEFGLQFMLNIVKFDDTQLRVLHADTLVGENMDSAGAGIILNNVTFVYNEVDKLNALLASGKTVVKCLDVNGFPENIGAIPDVNKCYIVDEIIRTREEGVYCYVLQGLKPNPPYQGYSSKRFVKIVSKTKSN